MSRVTELLAQISESEMKDFMLLSSKKKGATIFGNFKNYRINVDMASRCKSDDLRSRYDIQAEKYFSIASRQLKSLDDSELGDYLHVVSSRLTRAIENIDDSNWLATKMLYTTILNQVPKNLNEDNQQIFRNITDNFNQMDHELEK